jgi:hypothetical protein
MADIPETALDPAELQDFRRLAGIMVPASAEFGVPGGDDETVFADIAASLGRDTAAVRHALADLRELAGGAFTNLDADRAETVATALLRREGPAGAALSRAVLQCYYRDSRVMRALGREPRPPFPQGHAIAPTDWSLLDPQRGRPRMWRDIDGFGD